jgi:Secretion system C-terminal sorting domain
MTKFILLLIIFLGSNALQAQVPAIQWQKSLGGSEADIAYDSKQTKDGGYIISGWTASNDSDVVGFNGSVDCWVIKLDAVGNVQWKKCYGNSASGTERGLSITTTYDNGYAIAGTAGLNDDYWVFKIDSVGNMLWQKMYGGSSAEIPSRIIETQDHSLMVIGFSQSNNGDVTGNHSVGNEDIWLIKLNPVGNLLWQKCYGGTGYDFAEDIKQNSTGGFYIAGSTFSNNGDITQNKGSRDAWIIKIDSIGKIIWQKTFGGSFGENIYTLSVIIGDSILLGGATNSSNGDVTGLHGTKSDVWAIKLDSAGSLIWQKCYGGSNEDGCLSMCQTTNGDFVLAGITQSNNGDVSGSKGPENIWIIRIDNNGNLLWQKCCGGSVDEWAYNIITTKDGGFFITGYSLSADGDVTQNYGSADYWVFKLAPDPLPLKMIAYNASPIPPKEGFANWTVNNIWTTANEINVSHFNIQRSTNGRDFIPIGQVKAQNKSNNEYQFTDLLTINNLLLIFYYRIQSVDKDGRLSYSEIKKISTINYQLSIKVYPNPATNYVVIATKNAKLINITDCLGRIIQQLNNPAEHQTINTKQLPKGIYYITAFYNNGNSQVEQLLVQ